MQRFVMSHRCTFVPPYILDHIARVQARESLEPSPAQRSAVVSAEFRRARRYQASGILGVEPAAAAAAPKAVPPGLTAPPASSSGRLIYDDQNQWNENVNFIRGEGDPAVAGQNANRAYDYLGVVRQYYKDKLGRNSIDNLGLNIVGNVNFGVAFDNAFWDPSSLVMVFGNGSNVVFKDLTGDLDVPAHELTHGVTQFTAGLNYTPDQTGALNESFSDMLGSAIDAWANNRDAESHNWLIGEDIMADDLYGEALRNMAEPGTAFDNTLMGRDLQPRDMSGYYQPADPHIMSGIPNRWFYLICVEIGIEAGALIMYQTLQNLWPNAIFNDAALVAAAQARILAENKQVPPESAQVVRAAARQQGFW
jgi:Zn-dependent metalloprotease